MAKDRIGDRFEKRKGRDKLGELSERTRNFGDIQDEQELLDKTEKVQPITSDGRVKRNDPCPCSSGKKYKKCCEGKEGERR